MRSKLNELTMAGNYIQNNPYPPKYGIKNTIAMPHIEKYCLSLTEVLECLTQ